jgi:hypothetical protein
MRFVFALLAGLALICQPDYADKTASDGQRDRSSDRDAREQRRSPREGLENSKLRKPLPERGGHSVPPNLRHPRQDFERPSPGPRGTPIPNATADRRTPVRPQAFSRLAPSLIRPTHRSTNPATIAGSAVVRNRNTGAIDGAQVHRRP